MVTYRLANLFYGWWIVIASIPISIITGAFFYGFAALFDPILAAFGWSRAVTSVAFALQQGESGIAAPLVGVLTDRLGPRRIIIVGGVIYGFGFIMLGYTENLWMFYCSFLVIAIGGSGCNPLVSYITAAQWFRLKRGRAMAVLSAGTSLSGIMIYLLVLLISEFGWRHTVQILGLASWAIILPFGLFFRHKPQQYGLLPDGLAVTKKGGGNTSDVEIDFTLRESFGASAFWYMAVVFTLWTFVHGGVVSQLISALTLGGTMSRTAAGLAAAGAPLFSIIGRLGMGTLSDFADKRLVLAVSLIIQAASLIVFINATTPWLAILGSLLYGVGSGGVIPVRTALQADLFGPGNFGTIQGGLRLLSTGGGIAGPILAGWFADIHGSYELAYYVFFVSLVVAAGFVMALRQPDLPKKHAGDSMQ